MWLVNTTPALIITIKILQWRCIIYSLEKQMILSLIIINFQIQLQTIVN